MTTTTTRTTTSTTTVPGPPVLRIDMDFTAEACRLELVGGLDAGTADLLGDAVDTALRQRRGVVIDLREVSFCDVCGVDELLAVRRRAAETGGSVRLTGVRPFAQRVGRLMWAGDLLVDDADRA